MSELAHGTRPRGERARIFVHFREKISCIARAASALGFKLNRSRLIQQIGFLEKRLRNGWRKRQVTLVVSHKARP
jgi:hypothetical protein